MMLSLVKNEALRGGGKTLSDPRNYWLSVLRSLPLDLTNLVLVPRLYAIHLLSNNDGRPGQDGKIIMPPLRRLSAEVIERHGVFLMDDGLSLFLFVGSNVAQNILQQLFNVPTVDRVPIGKVALPSLDNSLSEQVNTIIGKIRESRPSYPYLYVLRDDGDPYLRFQFFSRLVEDRTEVEKSYQQFVVYVKEKSSAQ